MNCSISTSQRTAMLRGSYSVRNAAQNPQIRIYWGTSESLTFADRWEKVAILQASHEGENMFVIDNVPSGKAIYVRLLLTHSEGQFWSSETLKVQPYLR